MSVIHRPASMPATRRRLTGLVAVALAATVVVTLITSALVSRPGAAAPGPQFPSAARPDLASPPFDASAALAQGADALQRARETADPAAYAQAEAAFRSVLAAEPENLPALIGIGSLSLARHEFAEALATGRRASSLNSSSASALGIIGDAQTELGRYAAALTTVQRMVDLRPDLASYSRVSYQRELHGDLPGAIAAMQLAVDAAGPASENTEYVRVQLGNLQFATGDLAAARDTYLRALARLPDYHLALAGLARVAAAQGDLPAAIGMYQHAKARLPLPEIVVWLGETLEAAGHLEAARDEYALAEAMQRLNASQGMRVDLELAGFFADHGDAATALRLARRAHAERPTVFAADTLAWALYQSGRPRAALPFMREALRLGTRSSSLLFHAGVIEATVGRDEAARTHLAAALVLNPAFSPLDAPRAAALLEDLRR
jgi:tetratricopeptide (TPR) repeat protein